MKIRHCAYAALLIISFTACAGNTALSSGDVSPDAKAAAGSTSLHPAENTSLCLDVANASTANGTPVQIAACSGNQAQAWTVNNGQVRVFGNKCLDVKGGQTIAGASLEIWDCNDGDPAQRWSYQNNILQWTGHTNCVDLYTQGASNGEPVLMWTCSAQDNGQIWYLQQDDGGSTGGGSTAGSGSTGSSGSTSGGGSTTGNGNSMPISGGGSSDGSGQGSGRYTSLVWADDFNGSSLDSTKWNVEVNCDGGGNNEDECYTNSPANLQLDGQGHLLINAVKQSGLAQGRQFNSGRINSANKGDYKYGRYEARIQVPTGQGLWPAFWLMPQTSAYGGWPTSGELDIMEILGSDPSTLFGTAHYGVSQPYTESQGKATGVNFSQGYHVFAIERDQTQIRWYVDNQLYFTLNDTDATFWPAGYTPPDSTPWPFEQNFYVILNLAVGGQWPGAPDPSLTQGTMAVDYVHFYQ